MSFRIDISCTDCGKTASLTLDSNASPHEPETPVPAMANYNGNMEIYDLALGVRAFNCLIGRNNVLPRNATVSDLLNHEHPEWIKNFGKVTFAEIISSLEVEAGLSMEDIQKSRFWQTVPGDYKDMVKSSRYEELKAQVQRFTSHHPASRESVTG